MSEQQLTKHEPTLIHLIRAIIGSNCGGKAQWTNREVCWVLHSPVHRDHCNDIRAGPCPFGALYADLWPVPVLSCGPTHGGLVYTSVIGGECLHLVDTRAQPANPQEERLKQGKQRLWRDAAVQQCVLYAFVCVCYTPHHSWESNGSSFCLNKSEAKTHLRLHQ